MEKYAVTLIEHNAVTCIRLAETLETAQDLARIFAEETFRRSLNDDELEALITFWEVCNNDNPDWPITVSIDTVDSL